MAIFVQADNTGAQAAIFEAFDDAIVNRAEFPRRRKRQNANPYCAVTSLEEPGNFLSRKRRVLSQLPVLPTCQPSSGTYPKGAIARDEEVVNLVGRML